MLLQPICTGVGRNITWYKLCATTKYGAFASIEPGVMMLGGRSVLWSREYTQTSTWRKILSMMGCRCRKVHRRLTMTAMYMPALHIQETLARRTSAGAHIQNSKSCTIN